MLASTLAVALLFGFVPRSQAASLDGSAQCSQATLKGTYVEFNDGFQTVKNKQVPFAFAANEVFDGSGHSHGVYSISVDGKITSFVPFTSTYKINPNCTMTETITDATGAITHFDQFTSPSGSEFSIIETDAGVVTGGSR